MGMGTENRWTCLRRHRRFLLARGEEKGSIESKGEISGAKNTLKLEELHWVEAILSTLASECGCRDRSSRQVVLALHRPSFNNNKIVINHSILRDVEKITGRKHRRVIDSTMSQLIHPSQTSVQTLPGHPTH